MSSHQKLRFSLLLSGPLGLAAAAKGVSAARDYPLDFDSAGQSQQVVKPPLPEPRPGPVDGL